MKPPFPIPIDSKIIPGFKGFYRADIGGRIWSCHARGRIRNRKGKWRLLKSSFCGGYLCLFLMKDGKYVSKRVHQLVLEAFVGFRPEGRVGRHKDSDTNNNCLSNLEWSTQAVNLRDKILNGTHPSGENNPSALLDWVKVRAIRELHRQGKGQKDLGFMFGVSPVTIGDVTSGRSWKIIPLSRT